MGNQKDMVINFYHPTITVLLDEVLTYWSKKFAHSLVFLAALRMEKNPWSFQQIHIKLLYGFSSLLNYLWFPW